MYRKYILILSIAISAISLSFSGARQIKEPITQTVAPAPDSPRDELGTAAHELSTALNSNLQLDTKGLSLNTLELALKGYLRLQQQGMLDNKLLSIVDFSQSSRDKRFYLIDVENKKLLENTFVAHGKNSGLDSATNFSNEDNSEKSSLGFYLTKDTYVGKHGYSLKIEGLEPGFNDHAEERSIVMHGANYVNAKRAQSNFMGRSQGCPALPVADYKRIIGEVKDGSVLFLYYPDQNYLNNSQVLNGHNPSDADAVS